MSCPECEYLQKERAAIHEFDGKASRVEAERMAARERCPMHTEPKQESLAGMDAPKRAQWGRD